MMLANAYIYGKSVKIHMGYVNFNIRIVVASGKGSGEREDW